MSVDANAETCIYSQVKNTQKYICPTIALLMLNDSLALLCNNEYIALIAFRR